MFSNKVVILRGQHLLDCHLLSVAGWQFVLLGQLFVEALTNTRVCTVGANNDVAMVLAIVGAANHGALFVLQDGHDLFTREDLLLWHF